MYIDNSNAEKAKIFLTSLTENKHYTLTKFQGFELLYFKYKRLNDEKNN